jgi:Ca-activated chloride channel family protein
MLIEFLQYYEFARAWVLALLLVLPLIGWYRFKHTRKYEAALLITTTHFIKGIGSSNNGKRLISVLRFFTLATLIIAIAGPRKKFSETRTKGEGIDIMLCFDISGSMTETDFEPTRLEASKHVASQFVQQRAGDRIGVVIFSRLSYTLCPLTTDHKTVLSQIGNIQSGYLQEDGTAIGSGVATSVDRLRAGQTKSRIIILLTDGVDFGGTIPPDLAIKMAIDNQIKIYTIGVGTNIETDKPVSTAKGIQVQRRRTAFDENLLRKMAENTKGQYFHATDPQALSKIYYSINQLEKSAVEVTVYNRYEEAFLPFLFAAIIFLLAEIFCRYIVYNKWP